MLSQTSIIAASLIIAFIVFITIRGELPAYLGVYTGQSAVASGTPAVKTDTTSGAGESPVATAIDPFFNDPKGNLGLNAN